jgi:hypothetical protein
MNQANSPSGDQEIRIGYIAIHSFEDRSVRGGILVVDEKTRPYEFRVTGAIKPTNLQIILYGKSLFEYAYSELILKPLVHSVTENLSLIITKDRYFLNLRPHINTPVIYLVEVQEPSTLKIEINNKPPIFYAHHQKFANEIENAKHLLMDLYEDRDIFEPFNRLHEALLEIHHLKPESKENQNTD